MKKSILFLFLLGTFALSAQNLAITPDMVVVDILNFNFSDPLEEAVAHSSMVNNGAQTTDIKWEVELLEGPAEWQIKLCDNNTCYGTNVSSNIQSDIGLNEPITLAPGESGICDPHLVPNQTPGCGLVEVRLSTVFNPNNILATAQYEFKLGVNADCVVSIRDLVKENIQIFPNPATNGFFINGSEGVNQVDLYSMLGQPVKSYAAQGSEAYSLEGVPAGIYFVQLLDKQNAVIKTIKLNVR